METPAFARAPRAHRFFGGNAGGDDENIGSWRQFPHLAEPDRRVEQTRHRSAQYVDAMKDTRLHGFPGLAFLHLAIGHEDPDASRVAPVDSPMPSVPLWTSIPGECSAPIISTEEPSLLNISSPSGAMRPTSISVVQATSA